VGQIRIPKDVDELLELQDRAIQALQQATLALQIALQALQDSRVEKGDQQKMTFVPVPTNPFAQPYTVPVPNSVPYTTIIGGFPGVITTTGVSGMNSQSYNGSAQDVVMGALSNVQTAHNYCSGGSNHA
jgi:hypothetical protein